jgi:hypothetical protein
LVYTCIQVLLYPQTVSLLYSCLGLLGRCSEGPCDAAEFAQHSSSPGAQPATRQQSAGHVRR